VRFVATQVPVFQQALQELSSGRIEAEVVETDDETIVPVGVTGADVLPGVTP
jgi:hypothetical protein